MTSADERSTPWWRSVAAIAATSLAMLVLSWQRWPDVLIDFGHELYVAWQISEGRALGRDIQWVATGPLSPYLNGLLFKLFAPELRVLVVANVVVLVLLVLLVHALLSRLSDRHAATNACVVFLAVFAFGQYVGIGNYNYVTPYSHGVTHGLALALLSVFLLERFAASGRLRLLFGVGLAAGLVFLTKPEIFVATTAALGIRLCSLGRELDGRRRAGIAALIVIGTALVPPVVTIMLLLQYMPAGDAMRVTSAPWLIIRTPYARTPFYLQGMGLDHPLRNLGLLASWGCAHVAAIMLGFGAEFVARKLHVTARAAGLAVFSVVVLVLGVFVPPAIWHGVARPLPLVVLVGMAVYARRVFGPASGDRRFGASLGLAVSTFAFVLLGKMFLNARIEHYGFALAMPAFLLVVVWCTSSIPRHLRQRGLDGSAFRGLAIGIITVFVVVHVASAARFFRAKREWVGWGGNEFLADERGRTVREALRLIQQTSAPGETLTVIPDGVMVNFLAHRRTASRHLAFTPEMMAAFGEKDLLASLEGEPPALVLIVSRDASEYGARTFGKDYGFETMSWVRKRYESVAQIGGSPFDPPEYGMLLLRRNDTFTMRRLMKPVTEGLTQTRGLP